MEFANANKVYRKSGGSPTIVLSATTFPPRRKPDKERRQKRKGSSIFVNPSPSPSQYR
jgi:hypothetical protein